jgi:hypothetical protein
MGKPNSCRTSVTTVIGICVIALASAGVLRTSAHAGLDGHGSGDADVRGSQRPGIQAALELRALEAAKQLVRGNLAYPIVLIDPELAPDSAAVRRLDAFIVAEENGRLRPKIYVNRESPLFQSAATGDDFSVKALAAVLVHEVAHLRGDTEAGARAAEERFVRDLIAGGALVEADGLRYLAQLRQRPVESYEQLMGTPR